MADEVPDAEVAPEQQEVDYNQESLEDIEARFAAGEGLIVEDDTPPEPEVEPPTEPAAEADEPEQEATDGQEAEETPQEEVEGPDEKDLLLEEMRLQLLKTETERQKFEDLTGREAGRAGQLSKEIAQLRQVLQQPQQPQDEYAEPQQRPAPLPSTDPQLQASVTELQQDARVRAAEATYNAFIAEHPDAQEMMTEIAPLVKEQFAPYAEMQLGSQAMSKVLKIALNSSYADLRLQKVRTQRQEMVEKKASQVPEKKLAKQVASVSGSGSSPGPRAVPKSSDEMTLEEVDAALIKEFGDGRARRSR